MAFTRPSIETIYARIKADIESRLTNDITLPQLTFLDIIARVFAGAIHLCYGILEWLAEQLFISDMDEENLELEGIESGYPRIAAQYAASTAEFTGLNGTFIDVGTEIERADGYIYITTESGITDNDSVSPGVGSVTLAIQASLSGIEGNFAGGIMSLVDPAADPDIIYDNIIVPEITSGANIEDLEAYRQRLLLVKQTPPAGGRESDYLIWALSTPGVSKAWVYPLYLGAGTVGILIADSDFQVVSTPIKEACQENINKNRPLGVQSTVLDPAPITADIQMRVTPINNDIIAKINENLYTLFNDVAEPGGTITISSIRTAIGNAGVTDNIVDNISYDGAAIGPVNIVAVNFDLPYLRSTTITELM